MKEKIWSFLFVPEIAVGLSKSDPLFPAVFSLFCNSYFLLYLLLTDYCRCTVCKTVVFLAAAPASLD
jgi:hypothetical protein